MTAVRLLFACELLSRYQFYLPKNEGPALRK